MLDYSERAEKLLERFSEDVELDRSYGAGSLLGAVDNICGAIYNIADAELREKPQYWTRLDLSIQRELLYTYSELGRQGRNFADTRNIRIPYLGNGRASADIDALANDSGAAQYVAHAHPDPNKPLDATVVKLLAKASLEALLRMQILTDIPIEQGMRVFLSDRIDGGLAIMEKCLADAS